MSEYTIVNNAHTSIIFGELLPGDAFETRGHLYFKVDSTKAYMVDTGILSRFTEDDAVHPVTVEISYRYR